MKICIKIFNSGKNNTRSNAYFPHVTYTFWPVMLIICMKLTVHFAEWKSDSKSGISSFISADGC